MQITQSLEGRNILICGYGDMFSRRLLQLLVLEGARVYFIPSYDLELVHAIVVDCRTSKKVLTKMLERMDKDAQLAVVLTAPVCKQYELEIKRKLVKNYFGKKEVIIVELVQPPGMDKTYQVANRICSKLSVSFNAFAR